MVLQCTVFSTNNTVIGFPKIVNIGINKGNVTFLGITGNSYR